MKPTDNVWRKLMYPKDRREYHEGFLDTYSQDPHMSLMIERYGRKYYDVVIDIYIERLKKNDFTIGPQSVEEWTKLRESL